MGNETTVGVRQDRFEESLSDLSGALLVTTSRSDDVADLVAAIESVGSVDVRLLVDEPTAKSIGDSFLLASRVVDLVERGGLSIGVTSPESPFPTLLVGTDDVRSMVSIDGTATTELRADADDSTVEAVRESFDEQWANADQLSVRVPAYSQMLDTLDDRLGETMRADVEQVFEEATAVRGGTETVRPVRLSLLMGAKNGVQFYELGLWGESEGVASRAKFSREKQALEEQGLIDTEKVPTDVGRPRQRLVLPERLEGMDALELTSAARSVSPD